MYLYDKNLYFNETNSVLFDLHNYNIYNIRKEFLDLLDEEENAYSILTQQEVEIYNKIKNKSSMKAEKENSIECLKIHVSNTCNLKCRYCYAQFGNYGNVDMIMDSEMLKKLITYIKKFIKIYNLKYITFFGGEPFLAIDIIKKICEEFSGNDIRFLLQTNGTIMNSEILDLVKKFKITITVSLDGPEYINDFNRIDHNNRGTFYEIVKNIELINRVSRLPVMAIQATISDEFISKVNRTEISKFLYDLTNAKFIKVEYDIKSNHTQLVDKNEIEKEIKDFFNALLNEGYILDNLCYSFLKTFLTRIYKDELCSAGGKLLTIDVNGNIYPCQLFIGDESYCFGNIADDSSINLVNNVILLNKLENKKKSNSPDCYACLAKSMCTLCIANEINKSKCEYNISYVGAFLDYFANLVKEDKFNIVYNAFSEIHSY